MVIALTINLDSTPPPWWDEGWTMSVARNWVALGHYGRLLDGRPALRGLEAAFPVTAAVAVSFRLFGVGVIQARLVAVIFTLAALALLYELARRFYDRSIAIATLLVLIFMSGHVDINALVVGRQILAEIPSMGFLLAGYLCLILAEKRLIVFLPGAICFWALAFLTKVQLLPFWAVGLSSGLVVALIRRQWRSSRIFGVAFVGALMLYFCGQFLFMLLVPGASVSGLAETIALVFVKEARLIVMEETLIFGVPTLLGLCWGSWSFVRKRDQLQYHREFVQLSFLCLVSSWFAWYAMLSVGWPRYVFPAVFLGSVFVAALLDDWTNHFNLAYTIEQAGTALSKLRFRRQTVCALAAVVLIAMSLGQTLAVLYGAYVVDPDDSITDTLRYLNTDTPRNALIETYETELFFLLRRRYHYPPDQVHVDLIRRNSLGERLKIGYDPLIMNPDYLVVGPQSKFWDFYDPYLTTGTFQLVRKNNRYQIYEHIHSQRRDPVR